MNHLASPECSSHSVGPTPLTRLLCVLSVMFAGIGWPALSLSMQPADQSAGGESVPADEGWPRAFESEGKRLIVHQP